MTRPIRGERGLQKDFSSRAGIWALSLGGGFLMACAAIGQLLNGGAL